jgi:AcrR family transcriptional regulator
MEIKAKVFDLAQSLFMKYGVRSVSMDDIAQDAGISKKTIYKIIPNKKALVHKIIQHFIEVEKTAIIQIQEERIDAIHEMVLIAKRLLRLIRKTKPTLMHDLQKYHPESWALIENLHIKFIHQLIEKNIQEGITNGLYQQEIDPDIITKLYIGNSFLINDEKTFPRDQYNPEKVFHQFILYHLQGILSAEGTKLFETYKKDLF